jgi:hypothetical protein
MPDNVMKASRGASPILLVLAALCFLLPFVGVSCNTAAGGAALGSALSAAGGSGSAAAANTCLQSLNGKDLATYSGVNLLTGGNPATSTNIPGCDTGSTAAASTSEGGIGVQPLVLIAFLLILVGIAAAVLKPRLRSLVSGGAALVAGVLLIVDNATVHTQIVSKLTQGSGDSSLSSLGISGAADQFFDIHAALGFFLVLVALILAFLVNAAAAAMGSGLRLSTAGGAADTGPPADAPSGLPPPGPDQPPPPPAV